MDYRMLRDKRLCVVWICFLLVSSAFSLLAGDADASGLRASETNDPPVVCIDSFRSDFILIEWAWATADRPVMINGTASDSDGDVQFVEVKIDDGMWQPAEETESWSYEWNISGVTQGRHIVSARSYDGSDYSPVQSINVTIDTLDDPSPTVIITSPKQGEDVSGFVTIGGYTHSGGSVEYVEIKIDDGAWTKSSGPYIDIIPLGWSHNWSTADVEDGNHTISVRSYNGEYYSDAVSITVRVSNNHPPSVSITSPEDGATVNGTVVINGTASDADGGEQALNDTFNNRVEVRIDDGNWMTAIEDWMHVSNTTVTAWTYTWNTTEIEDGDYPVDVRAYDGIDHSDIESITVTVDNDKKDSDDTPGFETLSLLVALAAAFLLVRRRLQQ
jgi:hypothetical protein